jgi:adenosine/AMP kinase
MNINEMLRYEPKVGDIIMHTDGSYHVVITELKQGSSVVSAMHHINGTEPTAVYLNIPKTRTSMIQGRQFLVRKSDESG